MQGAGCIRTKAFGLGAHLESLEKHHELFVGLFVFSVYRALVAFHALLLKLKVGLSVGLKKINQLEHEITMLTDWIGVGQHVLKFIDVGNQQLMLLINRAGAGLHLFVP